MEQLPREQPWKAEVSCGFLASLVVTAVGGFTVYMEHIHPASSVRTNAWVAPVVGWSFLITGILMLLAILYNVLAMQSPETIVAANSSSLARGETLTLEVSQPGPIRLNYLRVDFRGERLYVPLNSGGSDQPKNVVRTHLGTFRMYSQDEVEVLDGDRFRDSFSFVIPAEIEPSGTTPLGETTWRVEVWGNVVNGFNFVHPFVINVA
jgi:hypothetical protein